MSNREMQNLLTLAAQELRQAASCFESIVKLKGDEGDALRTMIERERRTAMRLTNAARQASGLH